MYYYEIICITYKQNTKYCLLFYKCLYIKICHFPLRLLNMDAALVGCR